jgi:hypothetical protein
MIPRFQPYLILLSFTAISLFFSSILSASAKHLPGYQDTGINAIKMHIRTHRQITSSSKIIRTNPPTGNTIPGDAHSWEIILIDAVNNRTVQRIFEGSEKPAFSANPQVETYSINGTITSINHSRKNAYIQKYTPGALSSISMAYAGRVHDGNSLAKIISEASKTGKIQKKNDIFILSIGAPYFTPPQYPKPVILELNPHFLPTKLIEQKHIYTFDWKQHQPGKHWYVDHTLMTLKNSDNLMKYEQWIKQIEINIPILDKEFELSIPPNYKIHDLSKRLRSPFSR